MKLRTFKGGIHPPAHKEQTSNKPIVLCSLPPKVFLQMSQHIGQPARCLVKEGDRVKVGQKIGEADSIISAPVHSSVSGVVEQVDSYPNFMGRMVETVVILPDEQQEEWPSQRLGMTESFSPDQIREAVKEAGIVGMGGASFPTTVKLSPPPDKKIDAVIVNGCECELFLTCDFRLMLERTSSLIDGLRLIMLCVGANKGFIGIEDNKPEAIKQIEAEIGKKVPAWASKMQIKVCVLATKYPQGSEKQLINAVLKRVVPSKKLPSEIGALVQNAGTTVAISDAVRYRKPLIDRVVTVTGPVIRDPQNLRVKLGTPISWLIEVCGGFKETPRKVIMGGPMCGCAISDLGLPVVKKTSGVVALGEDMVDKPLQHRLPCVRCGKCAEICPMFLNPSLLGYYSEKKKHRDAEEVGLMDCIECGSCVYICPSRRPLGQLIRDAKAFVLSRKRN
ncbi:MAG: electron transport complex subunit RsxC [Deltaproteobacteria bacterium]|nr:electron transport complex subunit RsxC [Deltaproteobacteria bacterium]